MIVQRVKTEKTSEKKPVKPVEAKKPVVKNSEEKEE
jgi:hypothetical protein